MAEREGLDTGGILALVFGGIAWMSFLVAFFVADDPFFYLLFALACGGTALAFAMRARREQAAAVAAGATAAGALLLYGVTLMAALTAMVYAMGVLMFVALMFFLAAMFAGSSSASGSNGGCGCGDCCGSSSASCGCCDCASECGECGSCCGECVECGSCCGDCGGCGCIGFGAMFVHAQARLPWRERLDRLRKRGLPHHPNAPEFAQDVYLIRGARWCIGCFTTYPVFVLASAALLFAPPAWTLSLALGALLACAQVVSSAGLARWRPVKAIVKTCLGVGLAFLVSGIHQTPWPPAAKLGGLLALLGLAWLSTVPRARRMARHHQDCACVTTTRDAP